MCAKNNDMIKRVKLPKNVKKEIKKWFRKSFPNYPSKSLLKSKNIRLDTYLLGIYYDCKAEREDILRSKNKK